MQHLSEKEIDQLIALIRTNEIIYNKHHPQHKVQLLKDKVWHKISEALNIPEEHVRNAWRSLVDSFMRYNENVKDSATSRKPYKYQQALSFLTETEEQKQSSDANELMEFISDSSSVHIPLASMPMHGATSPPTTSCPIVTTSPSPSSSSSASDTSSLLAPVPAALTNSTKKLKNNRKRKHSTNELENGAHKFLSTLITTLEEEEDEVDCFFNCQAKMIRKFNLNFNELYDLEICVINCISNKLKEMGKK